ncbi:MAG: alpha/beta hydrolase [Okeania sp. SIO2F4]|uniref:alpha/beta hydrolase n=1 Tax=Okeania sp. SIO2F4 TaxID=2607790 RepID=UPI00142AC9A6|nr:alpha/beta hydrolase [Okeania sp. SIO2F4]NES03423.1 alpha/beta hydrolase [Okeania sp. SIO2F4]
MNSKINLGIFRKHGGKTKKRMLLWLGSLVLGTIPLLLITFSAKAAEQIYLNYGILRIGVSLTALENYAETGKVDEELKFYLLFINAENQQKLRNILNFQLKINPIQLAQGLSSQMGENLLNYLGAMIQVDGKNGAVAIREALITTAESQDFTPINLLQNFSGQIQFDIIKILTTKREFFSLIQDTEKLLLEVKQLTLTAATTEPKVNFSRLPDLRQVGNFYFYQETLKLNDKNRKRQFLVNLYLPSNLSKTQTIPVVILSPGLAAKLTQWQHLAKHLASHGFAVAKVQHPGSDFNHFQAFLDGEEKNIFQLQEFINRPLDISYLLDELELRNKSQFQGKLNLKNVGMAGQSFGAYTALALAGAKINFEQLKQDCLPQIKSLNPSLFLQCRALELPQKIYNLRDERIKSVLVMDPVNRSIFGRSGLTHINIPIFWVAGSEDQLTPVVIEQVYPFTWLPVKEKYFMLTKGAKHLDFNVTAIQDVKSVDDDSLNQLVTASSPVIKSYINAFGLAFFQIYVRNDSNYLNYLRSSYALAISEEPYNLGFLSTLTAAELAQVFARYDE